MTKLMVLVLAATVFSALYLVQVQYQSRQLFTQLERAKTEAHDLATERERLEVERRAQARSLRVANLAQERLLMRPITPAITEYVTPSRNPVAATGAEP